MTTWKQPLLAVDAVLVRFHPERGLEYGTAERQAEPARGEQALPGVLVRSDESLDEAAYRALADKAGVAAAAVRHLDQLYVFDTPGREDSTSAFGRERSWSLAFLTIIDPAADTAPTVEWHPENVRTLGLPFDHEDIVDYARGYLRDRLWLDVRMTRALTGGTFPTRVGSDLETATRGLKPHAGNFHRKLSNLPTLERLEERTQTGGNPANVWKWIGS